MIDKNILIEKITTAMNQSFNLGQIYWQQADSEYTSQHAKSETTLLKFVQSKTDLAKQIKELLDANT